MRISGNGVNLVHVLKIRNDLYVSSWDFKNNRIIRINGIITKNVEKKNG